jgi:hypothetical protein
MTLELKTTGKIREIKLGAFYLGGSFPRVRWITQWWGSKPSLVAYDMGGSFASRTSDLAAELAHCDSMESPDDGTRDHKAFASALRAALEMLGD